MLSAFYTHTVMTGNSRDFFVWTIDKSIWTTKFNRVCSTNGQYSFRKAIHHQNDVNEKFGLDALKGIVGSGSKTNTTVNNSAGEND